MTHLEESANEILSYYDSNENQFIEEESVVVQYVLLDKNTISNELVVADADLLASYESERSEFEGSSEKRASHILFEMDASSTSQLVSPTGVLSAGDVLPSGAHLTRVCAKASACVGICSSDKGSQSHACCR